MTVRGVEAIKMYMPPTKSKINANVHEERASTTEESVDITISNMSSILRYRQEWSQLLQDLDARPNRIRDSAFAGELKMSKFRSIYWALLLRVLSDDYRSWLLQREMQRNRYEKLKDEFVKNPHKTDVSDDDNPLSQSQQSVWNQYFSDQELFAIIKQDVVRTFPGVDFFRKDIIQDAMTNILFYYAREHPYMSYRQGMHEILAPILFVTYSDHQAFLHYSELSKSRSESIDETLLDVLNTQYLEADVYSVFSRLMSSIESYYRINNSLPTTSGYLPTNTSDTKVATSPSSAANAEVEVIAQLNYIRDKILAKEDSHLYKCLLDLDIPLHLFGIRWLRLLFGREFMLVDLLMLWDAIFADSDRFELPNYILVAMLIRIRDRLLMSDYTTCLTHLMRYPTNEDANLILRHALHMQMPSKFEQPLNAFVYITANMNSNGSNNSNRRSSGEMNLKISNNTSRDKIVSKEISNSVEMRETAMRLRATSLCDSTQIHHQISILQEQNASDIADINESIVNDGYSENSPELLRLELKNVQTVIMIARKKLQDYLTIVRAHAPKIPSGELAQALDGIEELCHFLDLKFMFPQQMRTRAPIDQATEANERKTRKSKRSSETVVSVTQPSIATNIVMDPVVNEFNSLNLSSGSYAAEHAIAFASGLSTHTNYEKPDVGFMFNSSQLLGNLKEIEMLPIASDEKIAPTVLTSPNDNLSSP